LLVAAVTELSGLCAQVLSQYAV